MAGALEDRRPRETQGPTNRGCAAELNVHREIFHDLRGLLWFVKTRKIVARMGAAYRRAGGSTSIRQRAGAHDGTCVCLRPFQLAISLGF